MYSLKDVKESSLAACLPRVMLGLALALALGVYALTVEWLAWPFPLGVLLALLAASGLMLLGLRWLPPWFDEAAGSLGLDDDDP